MFIILFECKTISGYIERINLKVTAKIAEPIFIIKNDEKISGNYSDITKVPEYTFEIKNYNDENKISEITFNIKLEAESQNEVEFEVVDCDTNEVVLNNNQKSNEIIMEKDKLCLNKYKVIVNSNLATVKDSLKININGKYFKQELEVFNIEIDKRELEYEVYVSDADKKYTNKDVTIQIKCNKEVKSFPGFELSSDKKCLIKVYDKNTVEEITVQDYFNNKKNIQVLINNIDKTFPEIAGVEEGKIYDAGIKLVYKDNIGIRSIKVENTSIKQSYSTMFDTENKVIDNQFLVIRNNSINPYYLNKSGNYTITVTDFAGNQIVRHISIK